MVETFRSVKPESVKTSAKTQQLRAQTADSAPRMSWAELLQTTIETEILPLLLVAQPSEAPPGSPASLFTSQSGLPSQADIELFVRMIIADEIEQARNFVDRVVVQSGGRAALLQHLLTPAARHLGVLWEQDVCDFMDVTLGVYRLDQFMKETQYSDSRAGLLHTNHDNRALLLPAPGEQHSFGIGMVADVFREAGWCVRSGPGVARQKLLRLVRNEWFDMVGLSVSSERWLGNLSACIRAIREASCNPDVFIVLGGPAIVGHEERTRFLGADMIAVDAYQALESANLLVSNLARKINLQAPKVATLT